MRNEMGDSQLHWTLFLQKLVTASLEAVEEANDRSKYMCFMLSGDRIAFDSRRCDIIFPMKSVQTTYSSKGDVSYLYEGKTKELSREREREREREFAKLVRFWLVRFRYIRLWDLVIPRKKAELFLQTVKPNQTPHSIISIWLFFFFLLAVVVIVERSIRHQVMVI